MGDGIASVFKTSIGLFDLTEAEANAFTEVLDKRFQKQEAENKQPEPTPEPAKKQQTTSAEKKLSEAQLKKVQELNLRLDAKDAELRELERQRLEQMRELEDRVEELRRQAHEDPNATRPAFGADSMRRLNAVRGD